MGAEIVGIIFYDSTLLIVKLTFLNKLKSFQTDIFLFF